MIAERPQGNFMSSRIVPPDNVDQQSPAVGAADPGSVLGRLDRNRAVREVEQAAESPEGTHEEPARRGGSWLDRVRDWLRSRAIGLVEQLENRLAPHHRHRSRASDARELPAFGEADPGRRPRLIARVRRWLRARVIGVPADDVGDQGPSDAAEFDERAFEAKRRQDLGAQPQNARRWRAANGIKEPAPAEPQLPPAVTPLAKALERSRAERLREQQLQRVARRRETRLRAEAFIRENAALFRDRRHLDRVPVSRSRGRSESRPGRPKFAQSSAPTRAGPDSDDDPHEPPPPRRGHLGPVGSTFRDAGHLAAPDAGGFTDEKADAVARAVTALHAKRLSPVDFDRAVASFTFGLDADETANAKLRVFVRLPDGLQAEFYAHLKRATDPRPDVLEGAA